MKDEYALTQQCLKLIFWVCARGMAVPSCNDQTIKLSSKTLSFVVESHSQKFIFRYAELAQDLF